MNFWLMTKRKSRLVWAVPVLALLLAIGYYYVQAIGAPVDLLGGNGSFDTAGQVNAWTKVDVTGGTHTYSQDTTIRIGSTGGSGKLVTPSNTVDRDVYIYNRFTPASSIDSANITVNYRKSASNTSTKYWTIVAELWSTGGSPQKLESFLIANNNLNVTTFTAATLRVYTKMDKGVQYELRLRQYGKMSTAGTHTVYFDNVQINGNYDVTPPSILEAKANTDNSVDVYFMEKVDPTTAQNVANYSISPSLGTLQSAIVLSDGKTVRVSTTSKQEVNKPYTITISNVKDLSLNTMSAPESFTFNGVDTTAPQIASVTATNGTTVKVIFNEPVTEASAEAVANYTIPGLTVSKAVWQIDKKTVYLTTSAQTSGTNYTLTINDVKDLAYNPISGGVGGFTGREATPPSISTTTVVNDNTVDIQFSEALDPSSAQNVVNYSISPRLRIMSVRLQADNRTVRLITGSHIPGTTYTISIQRVTDLAGNAVAAGSQTTFVGADTTPPAVTGVFAVSSTAVDVVFSEAIQSAGAQNVANYAISPTLAVSSATLQGDNKTVRLVTAAMAANTTYTVTVSNVVDLNGNALGSTNSGRFTSYVTDTTGPTLVSAVSTDVYKVVLYLSERIQRSPALNLANYSISGGITITDVNTDDFDRQIVLTTGRMVANAVYTVTITNTNNIKDMAGNTLTGSNSTTYRGYSVHGFYLSDTDRCAVCHVTHSAPGKKLLVEKDPEIICLICHDSAGISKYQIGGAFYKKSMHPVISGVVGCTDCHNPHGNQKDANTLYPKLLKTSDGTNDYYEGNQVCLACHGSVNRDFSPDYYANTGGDHANVNAVHYNLTEMGATTGTLPTAPSTGIACMYCHDSHGSQNSNLIKDNIAVDINKGGEELCLKCHNSAANSMSGRDINAEYSRTGSLHDLAGTTGRDAGTVEGCTSCHGPHTVANVTYANSLNTGKSDMSNPDNTKQPWTRNDGTMVDWCLKCHDGSPSVAVESASMITPYSVIFPPIDITINASGYKKNIFKKSTHNAEVGMSCEMCHEEHGSNSYNLWKYGEDTRSGSTVTRGLCLRCHYGATVNGKTAKNIEAELLRPTATTTDPNNYRHPVLDKESGVQHNNTEDYRNRPLADRHAECSDCHDPHYEIPTPSGTTSPEPPGAYINISGVAPVMDGEGLIDASGNPITWDSYKTSDNSGNVIGTQEAQFVWKRPISAAYEICLKCHSYYSYNTTPPTPGGSRKQTDPVKEFNPRNASTHAVMGPSKANPNVGAYVGTDRWGNTWTASSRLYCEDCHGSSQAGSPRGPHGSANKYILKKPYKPTTDTEGQNGTGADADSSSHLCFNCHDSRLYLSGGSLTNTGFKSGSTNLHTSKHNGRACNSCHSMVIHGSKWPRLLSFGVVDPYPYNNNSKLRLTPNSAQWTGTDAELVNWINSKSGNWSENDCNAHSNKYNDGKTNNCG